MKLNIALSTFCVLLAGILYDGSTGTGTTTLMVEAKINFGSSIRIIRTINKIRKSKPWGIVLKVRNGEFWDAVDGLDPTITWDDSFKIGDSGIEIDYGAEAVLNPAAGAANVCRKIYCQARTKQPYGEYSLRGDMNACDRSVVDLQFDVTNDDIGVSAGIDARVGTTSKFDFNVGQIEGSYTRDTNILDQPGQLVVTPQYDLSAKTKDILVSYESGKTKAELKLADDGKELKVERKLRWSNSIGLVLTDAGMKSTMIDYHRDLENNGSLDIDYKDNQGLVNWKDGNGWEAKGSVDIDKTGFHNANVRIGNTLEF